MRNILIWLAGAAMLLAGCDAPVRNMKLADDAKVGFGADAGYRLGTVRKGLDHGVGKTLFVASFSGGGTRATALAAGALEALEATVWNGGDGNRTLADEIDIVSSVSGGSVTAAHFALYGAAGLKRLEDDFVRRNIIGDIVLNALRPDHLLLLPTAERARIDSLIDVFRERLFSDPDGKALTFEQLGNREWIDRQQPLRKRPRIPPYLILNAGDMGSGTVFPFTQDWFDLICSDLTKLHIADAVAASAAFPVALSPVLLKNQTVDGCEAHDRARARTLDKKRKKKKGEKDWPPQALANAFKTSPYRNPGRNRRARLQARYLEKGDGAKKFVHLLDSGIADNVGLSEPLNMISAATAEGSLRQAILDKKITRIIWLVVNARSEKASELDGTDATPGLISQLSAVTGASIDNATFGRIYRLNDTLRDLLTRDMQWQIDNARLAGNGAKPFVEKLRPRRLEILRGLKVHVLPVDFDFVGPEDCRKRLKSIDTWWNLPKDRIDLLYAVGKAMVYAAPDYARLFADGVIRPPRGAREKLEAIRHTAKAEEKFRLAHTLGLPLAETACSENVPARQ